MNKDKAQVLARSKAAAEKAARNDDRWDDALVRGAEKALALREAKEATEKANKESNDGSKAEAP